jgi:hypothetical protein
MSTSMPPSTGRDRPRDEVCLVRRKRQRDILGSAVLASQGHARISPAQGRGLQVFITIICAALASGAGTAVSCATTGRIKVRPEGALRGHADRPRIAVGVGASRTLRGSHRCNVLAPIGESLEQCQEARDMVMPWI